jgi:hypothetical protein
MYTSCSGATAFKHPRTTSFPVSCRESPPSPCRGTPSQRTASGSSRCLAAAIAALLGDMGLPLDPLCCWFPPRPPCAALHTAHLAAAPSSCPAGPMEDGLASCSLPTSLAECLKAGGGTSLPSQLLAQLLPDRRSEMGAVVRGDDRWHTKVADPAGD